MVSPTFVGMTFLGGKIMRYLGKYVPLYLAERVKASLAGSGRHFDDVTYFGRLLSLRALVTFDKTLFDELSTFAEFMLRRLSSSSHLMDQYVSHAEQGAETLEELLEENEVFLTLLSHRLIPNRKEMINFWTGFEAGSVGVKND